MGYAGGARAAPPVDRDRRSRGAPADFRRARTAVPRRGAREHPLYYAPRHRAARSGHRLSHRPGTDAAAVERRAGGALMLTNILTRLLLSEDAPRAGTSCVRTGNTRTAP